MEGWWEAWVDRILLEGEKREQSVEEGRSVGEWVGGRRCGVLYERREGFTRGER